MKTINVTEMKARLSHYLRMASRGERIIVRDHDGPIAQLVPLDAEPTSWRERLGREGRLRLGSQAWSAVHVSEAPSGIRIQGTLNDVREDPSEVRGPRGTL